MTIYVDNIRHWPQAPKPGAERWFGNGKPSCHMTTDGPLAELHCFARRIGLLHAWFDADAHPPHYDLVPNKRKLAIRAGAIARDITDNPTQQQGVLW